MALTKAQKKGGVSNVIPLGSLSYWVITFGLTMARNMTPRDAHYHWSSGSNEYLLFADLLLEDIVLLAARTLWLRSNEHILDNVWSWWHFLVLRSNRRTIRLENACFGCSSLHWTPLGLHKQCTEPPLSNICLLKRRLCFWGWALTSKSSN